MLRAGMVVTCSLLLSNVAFGKVIKVASGEWGNWSGKSVKNNGFVIHVLRESLAEVKKEARVDFFPWKRAYFLATTGRYDATAYWYDSAERRVKHYYSEAVSTEKVNFFVLKSNKIQEWKKLDDFKGLTIGLSDGHTYPEELMKKCSDRILKCDFSENNLLNMRKLYAKRVDVFPVSQLVGIELIRKHFSNEADRFTSLKKPLSISTGHILFPKSSPNSKSMLEQFNQGLRKLKASGKYEKMYKNLLEGKYHSE